ncbi:uncharacterized protein LOC124189791 [Daphnia pulex]|uniref:uncharacterized protein LOC124189791 n=1 Tax=Daphnia pulex TaxID=6669 RepID=UPI001EDDB857|nr:uncharacterized protein LOC124189791 [Daphnia pulex]XP_046438217.1 uncharacterized protein LOC124189791 [Daphnia pulex]
MFSLLSELQGPIEATAASYSSGNILFHDYYRSYYNGTAVTETTHHINKLYDIRQSSIIIIIIRAILSGGLSVVPSPAEPVGDRWRRRLSEVGRDLWAADGKFKSSPFDSRQQDGWQRVDQQSVTVAERQQQQQRELRRIRPPSSPSVGLSPLPPIGGRPAGPSRQQFASSASRRAGSSSGGRQVLRPSLAVCSSPPPPGTRREGVRLDATLFAPGRCSSGDAQLRHSSSQSTPIESASSSSASHPSITHSATATATSDAGQQAGFPSKPNAGRSDEAGRK